MKPEHTAEFRFYQELNDFLPTEQRQRSNLYRFNGRPGIKDPIEAFGVPHPEVELIVVNGRIEAMAPDESTGRLRMRRAMAAVHAMQLKGLATFLKIVLDCSII